MGWAGSCPVAAPRKQDGSSGTVGVLAERSCQLTERHSLCLSLQKEMKLMLREQAEGTPSPVPAARAEARCVAGGP